MFGGLPKKRLQPPATTVRYSLRNTLWRRGVDSRDFKLPSFHYRTVTIKDTVHASIGRGLLVLIGIAEADTPEDAAWLGGKIIRLRLFPDVAGAMNQSMQETSGDVLVVSQFTLPASSRKGNRPSYIRAARPEIAIHALRGVHPGAGDGTGQAGAQRSIWSGHAGRPGPVTIWIDTKARE